jgi:hypothetical protein
MKVLTPKSEKYYNFGTHGFNDFVFSRVESIIGVLRSGEDVFNIDSDVIMFEEYEYFTRKVGAFDVIFQQEHDGKACTGFFVCRSNPTTISFWEEVRNRMLLNQGKNDEAVANEVLASRFPIYAGYFNTNDITNYGVISDGKIWNGEEFEVPKGIKGFHANYTVGLENKKKLLGYVLANRK